MLAVFADEPGKAEMPYQYMDPRVSYRPLRKAVELRQHGLAGTIKGSTERRYRRELRCWFLLQREDVALSDISTVGFQHLYVDLAGGLCRQVGIGINAVRVLDLVGRQDRPGLYSGGRRGEPMAGN